MSEELQAAYHRFYVKVTEALAKYMVEPHPIVLDNLRALAWFHTEVTDAWRDLDEQISAPAEVAE